MRLTTKRNRWYFWRELFSYMIPMILIIGTVDVFYHFMQCSLHSAEMSAPCDVNRILAAAYGIILLLVIILAIIATKALRKVKKKIENEFFLSIKSKEIFDTIKDKNKFSIKSNKNTRNSSKKNGIIKLIEKNKHEEDNSEKGDKIDTKKSRKKIVESNKKTKKKKVSKK